MITRVTINTWPTKTFLKRNCEAYLAQLNLSALETAREGLLKVKEEKIFPEWRHYCGEKPRYWDVKIGNDAITFEGGLVWRAEIEDGVLYTDGCTTRGLLLDVVGEGIRQVRALKCDKSLLHAARARL
jgi:hypothetical protein